MLSLRDVNFSYDHQPVLRNISFAINAGDKICLVGPNGVGKSTLLKLILEELKPESGNILRDKSITIGYLPQVLTPWRDKSTLEFIRIITGVESAEQLVAAAASKMATDTSEKTVAEYQLLYEQLESLGGYTLESRMSKALARVGLKTDVLDIKIGHLSGGQRTKVALAAILLSQYDLFLLDEPTNNLDLEGIKILESFVRSSKYGFIVVSHDRRFLRTIAQKVIELLPSRHGMDIYTLGYEEYIESRRKKRAAMAQAYEEYVEEKKRISAAADSKMRQARAAAADRSSSDSEKIGRNAAREKAVGAHARAGRSLQKRLDQMVEPDRPIREIDLNFEFGQEGGMGDLAFELQDCTQDYGKVQIGPINLRVAGGEKLVITGPNGGGKSTILHMAIGMLHPSQGRVKLGAGVKLGLIDQDQTLPSPTNSLIDNFCELTGLPKPESHNVLARFNLKGDDLLRPADDLSPGQRSRALLASLVIKGTNCLLLDEPTNHLDIEASEELESAVRNYSGTMVVVTHDREFIDAIKPTRTIVVRDGKLLNDQEAKKYLGG